MSSWARSTRPGVLLILVFVLTLPGVTRRIYASDEIQYFSFLRSLWFDGDVSFDNEYRFFYDSGITRYDGFRDTFLEAKTETGRRLNFGTIGCAILWSPFYAIVDLGVMAARAFGSTVPQNGLAARIGAVCIGSPVRSAGAAPVGGGRRRVLSPLGHQPLLRGGRGGRCGWARHSVLHVCTMAPCAPQRLPCRLRAGGSPCGTPGRHAA